MSKKQSAEYWINKARKLVTLAKFDIFLLVNSEKKNVEIFFTSAHFKETAQRVVKPVHSNTYKSYQTRFRNEADAAFKHNDY